MTSMKNSLRNVSPRPEIARCKESREHRLVNNVRKEIREWPEKLQNLFIEIEGEVEADEENELLKIFQDLVELKGVVEGEVEVSNPKEYVRHIEKCLNYLNENDPYLPPFKAPYYYEPESANVTELSDNIPVNTSGSYFWLIFVIVVPVLTGCIYISLNSPGNTGVEPNKIAEWTQNIKDLQKQFPSQNEKIWSSIMSGVKTIVTEKPTKPSVLLLLHNDKKTSACLADQVGQNAVRLLSDTSQKPIVIQGEELKLNDSLTKDYGLFSESYKHDIEKIHVMIVHDLQEVPGTIAQTFHVLCDVENPLVRNAAFLFTMQVDEKEKKTPTKIAEDYLKNIWKDTLSNDILDPLITRITDAVESVKMESILPC
ncbi:hypothetical protein R5R35_010725 [Gryllus longicercus]|uniref:Torsin-1A-interacting protein 1/2 AAA+ activator domain-containing protein n=1 Tax=Gryllus longicercus TaxID=2509291 RepID=A0AAN9YZN2_9ORTH